MQPAAALVSAYLLTAAGAFPMTFISRNLANLVAILFGLTAAVTAAALLTPAL